MSVAQVQLDIATVSGPIVRTRPTATPIDRSSKHVNRNAAQPPRP